MADSRTRRKPPSRSRSRSPIRSPSSVDPDDNLVVLASRRKPTGQGTLKKNIKPPLNVLGMASKPVTTAYNALDTLYGILYDKGIQEGTKRNQVKPNEPRATQIPNAYPIFNTRRGGKKKRSKRKTRKNKK